MLFLKHTESIISNLKNTKEFLKNHEPLSALFFMWDSSF